MPDGTLTRTRHDRLAAAMAEYRAPIDDAAKRALALLDEVECVCSEIDVMHAELRRAGGHQVDLRAAQTLSVLRAQLRRIGGV